MLGRIVSVSFACSAELPFADTDLGRSWRREFGPNSEWGRKGMFRVITLDQFAECLVELGG